MAAKPTVAINGIYLSKQFYGSGFHSYLNNLLRELIKATLVNQPTLKNNYLIYSANFYKTSLDNLEKKIYPAIKKKILVKKSQHYLKDIIIDLKKNYPEIKKIFLPHLELIPSQVKKGNYSITMTIHDIIPILNLSGYYRKKFNLPLRNISLKGVMDYFLLKRNFKLVQQFITISHTSKQDLNYFFKSIPKNILVIPPLTSHHFKEYKQKEVISCLSQYHLPYKQYVIYFGGHTLRKNVKHLLRYWLKERLPYLPLVVVGEIENRKKYGVSNLNLKGESKNPRRKIIFLKKLEITTLVKLIAGALFSIYPSLYEGYGLPIIESLKCRTLPLASHIPSTIEITQELLPTFNPKNFNNLETIIKKYSNPRVAKQLINTLLKKIKISNYSLMVEFDKIV